MQGLSEKNTAKTFLEKLPERKLTIPKRNVTAIVRLVEGIGKVISSEK